MNYDTPKVIVENRADPQVFKHSDGYYYFTGSYPVYDRIVLRRSETIDGLTSAKEYTIWNAPDSGNMSQYIWAPEIHYINNAWYIYFAAKGEDSLDHFGNDPHKIYVLECKDENPLIGKWEEKGQLKTNWESFSLDATTFEHRGQRYLVWAQNDPEIDNNSNIYIAKMSSPWEIEGSQLMLTKPDLPWEVIGFKVNEGPAVIELDGKIILAYSASATDANYCMGMLTADVESDLMDINSWSKSNKPIRTTDAKIKEFGPGHNSFTIAEDGETPLLIYHARDYEKIVGDPLHDINRHAKVVKFTL